MSKQVNYNENLCSGAAIRDDKGRRISKLFEASHPKMTVGYAKNLIMPNDPTEQEFNFRQAGGGVIEDGVAVIDKVKGKSLVWNQLVNIHSKIDDGEIEQLNFTKGHKYLVFWKQDVDIPSSTRNTLRIDFLYYQKTGENNHPNAGYYNWMFTFEEDSGTHYLAWWVQDYPEGVTPSISNILFYDLTQMFGTGNEPSTVEEFLRRKPKVADEYAYNEGTIVNNKVEKVVTTGRNLCPYLERGTLSIYNGSEEPSTTRVRTPFIPISNKHSYCTMLNKWSIRNGCFYDRNKNFISSGYPSTIDGVLASSAIPANAAFYRLIYSAQNSADVVTPSYDVFMFAVGNATIPTTKYEPYEKHELDLSWIAEIKDENGAALFEDGMKSVGTIFDEVKAKVAVKRFVVIDLGSLNWYKEQISIGYHFYSDIVNPLPKGFGYNDKANVICPLCPTNSRGTIVNSNVDGITIYDDNRFYLRLKDREDMTNEQFKASLQGVYALYELAEPIEVEYDEKNLTYPVVAGGTEEAIASEPSTAFRADIGYGIDAVKTILDLKARVEALEGK